MSLFRVIRFLFLAIWLASAMARADSAPQLMIQAYLEPAGPVVAGSQIKLVVDCLTTTWFTEAPDWPLFTVPGAIVSLPDEQAQNLHEVINGVDWFGVSRAYRIVPQNAQMFVIPSFAITVQPGQMSTSAKLMTPVLKFSATVPAGAEGMRTFFPSQKLIATQTVAPSPEHVRAGDEITRTITQRAAGTQSMLIPPVEFSDVAGLRRYPRSATTHDILEDRAGLVAGERTDSVTYVVDHGGKYTLPAVTVEWWNTAEQRKETIVLPAVTLSAVAVAEKPRFAIPVDALSKGAAHRIVVIDRQQVLIFCLILVMMLAMVWGYSRLLRCYRWARQSVFSLRHRYSEGAAPAWRTLRRAMREGSLSHIVPALYRWMDKSNEFKRPARLECLRTHDDDGLAPLVDAVSRHYSDRSNATVHLPNAKDALRQAEKHARKVRKKKTFLPPLNRY